MPQTDPLLDLDGDVKQILLSGFDSVTKKLGELGERMASVEVLNSEFSTWRHQLREEITILLGKEALARMELEKRVRANEMKDAERKGRETVLMWLVSGSGGLALVSTAIAIFLLFR
jgi:hypothetical protein